MSEKTHFDVAVLGGGPGGYTAAFRAADLGLSVCLINEQERLGGVCLNVGCIPSKTLLHAAAVIEAAAEAHSFGLEFASPKIDFDIMREQKNSIIGKLTDGLAGLAKARKITTITGRGVFSQPGTIEITGEQEEAITFDSAIIATGSRPFHLPDSPDDERIWTSTDALALKTIPQRLLIIGGGVIGMEMAQVYGSFGSEITIVEMMDQIIPPADKDVIGPLFQKVKKLYTIFTKTRVTAMTSGDSSISVTMESTKGSDTREYDAVLVAVGRRPNTLNFGLDSIGVEINDKGFIGVNEKQQTSAESIYAIGDVVGEPMLAHKATHQGKVAAEVIAGQKSAFSPMAIPSVAYTLPEVAWMGVTEKEAREKNIEYEKGKFNWGASGRALTSGAATGGSKVLFSKDTGRIIGAAICGEHAGELIQEAVLALEMGADAEDISKTIHAHPTLSETFAFAAEMVDGSITDGLPPRKKKG